MIALPKRRTLRQIPPFQRMQYLAWPVAALLFAVVFLLLFRQQIAAFLTRVKSVGRHGVSTLAPSGQRSIEQQADAPTSREVQDLLQTFDSPALRQEEHVLIADLQTRRLDSASDTTKILVRHLAKTRLLLACEFIYRFIFGSQIALLKRINTAGRIPEAEAHQFYRNVATSHPDVFAADQPEPYLDFLIRQNLIIRQDDYFLITGFGREFLVWLAQSGASENKEQ
jgi:hypothetical protein